MYLGQGSILFTVPTRAQRIGWFGLYRGFRYLICNKAVVFDETRIASQRQSASTTGSLPPAPPRKRARASVLYFPARVRQSHQSSPVVRPSVRPSSDEKKFPCRVGAQIFE